MEVLLKTLHPLGQPTSRFLLQASLRKSGSCLNFHSIPSPYLGLAWKSYPAPDYVRPEASIDRIHRGCPLPGKHEHPENAQAFAPHTEFLTQLQLFTNVR